MPNEKNLKHFTSEQSREEAVKNGHKGGIASGEARRRRRDLKRALETLLEKEFKTNNQTLSGAEAIAFKLFEKALKGDIRAFEVVRDTTGQRPIEKVAVADVDVDVINEVEEMVRSYEQAEDD